jgi:CheY-like chemotaxis protein
MAKNRLLIADNNKEQIASVRWFFERDGFKVVEAHTPDEAIRILKEGRVDIAILDLRMVDDRDHKDTSGFQVAIEAPLIPKIIYTQFPSYELVRTALTPTAMGQPLAAEFVSKSEGVEKLQLAVIRIRFNLELKHLEAQQEPIEFVRKQERIFRNLTIGVAITYAIFLLICLGLAVANVVDIKVAGAVGTILAASAGGLFYTLYAANRERVREYDKDLIENRRLKDLTEICEQMETRESREDCIREIIAANQRLFAQNSAAPESTPPVKEVAREQAAKEAEEPVKVTSSRGWNGE